MKVDMIVIRHPNPGAPHFLSKRVDATIINAGDGTHEHPTQALLDSYSIRNKLGDLNGKNILIVGDIMHSRVALSNFFALKMQGANVKVCAPKTLIPRYIEDLDIRIENDLDNGLDWCDAVNMLRLQNERMKSSYIPTINEYKRLYSLNSERILKLKKNILIMHPGPINRGVEITSEVADSENSIILNQVENGVAIRMAVIYLLAKKNFNR